MRAIGAAWLAAALFGIGGASACSPCAGVADCRESSPRVSASGELVRRVDGRPVVGAEVQLVPTGGARVVGGELTARTDAAGTFTVTAVTDGPGEVTADLVVSPPAPFHPYRVRGLRLAATTRHGEGVRIGRMLADPRLNFVGELRDRRTGAPVPNASVYLYPSDSGVAGADPIAASSDGTGRFQIVAPVTDVRDVVGDLLVVAPGITSGTRIPRVRLSPTYLDEPPGVGAVFLIGASLDYFGEILFRGTRTLVTGTDVTFRRTGGLDASPPSVTVPIDRGGRFRLALSPNGEGTVLGELTFTPSPGARPVTIPNVRLSTYDSSETRLAQFAFGEQLLYVGEIVHRGSRERLPNVAVEFRRTGGVPIAPAAPATTTDATGRFSFAPATTDSGEVVGDLVLRAPDEPPVTYAGVRLRTFAADEVRFAGVWGVGEHLQYVGELWSNTTRRPVGAGVAVTFRRTGGIRLLSDTITSVTGPDGRFLLFPKTTERGEVTGELLVQPPGGAPQSVVPGVRLGTFGTDEVRFAGLYGFGPSLLYVGEVLRGDTDRPVVGARVEFRRTGGIATTPEVTAAVTDAVGRFPLGLVPQASGEVVGTVTVRPPAPWPDAPIVFENVRAATFETGELRLLVVLRIPPPN